MFIYVTELNAAENVMYRDEVKLTGVYLCRDIELLFSDSTLHANKVDMNAEHGRIEC